MIFKYLQHSSKKMAGSILFIFCLANNFSFGQPASGIDVTPITDLCEDDNAFTINPITPYEANSGYAGLAIFVITGDLVTTANNGVDFSIQHYDYPGGSNYLMTEADLGSIQPNTLYMLYDNPCIDITDIGQVPEFMWTGGIPQQSSSITGCGYYIYYYASDGIEVINNKGTLSTAVQGFYYDPSDPNNLGNVPSFYTTNTHKRFSTIQNSAATKKIILPQMSEIEYFSSGEWTGTGVSSVGTESKDYFPAFLGLNVTAISPSGHADFDPSAAPIGPNHPLTFTYNSVMGVNGPAPCNIQTVTTHEIDIHALPEITPVPDQDCNGPTYDVTIDVDLGTYNVSVDEDGGTPFSVSGSGGVVSTSSLTGTGTTQVTITGIPTGSPWSLDVADVTGLGCGLTGVNGNCITVLPVELIGFSGYDNGYDNVLVWQTASEKDNAYFVVEKSRDGIHFEDIPGIISGAGNSHVPLNYSKTDLRPYLVTYYRLRQVDFNGEFSYSNVIVISNDRTNVTAVSFSIYPNPVKDDLTLIFSGNKEESIDVMITNSIGQLVQRMSSTVIKGTNSQTFSLDDLSPGIYTITLQSTSQKLSSRFVKM